MTDYVLNNETSLRMGIFLSILLTMMLAEYLFPRKQRALPRARRWTSNLLLIAIDSVFVKLVFPIVAVGAAIMAEQNGWGLLSQIDLPLWAEVTIAIIILDMMIYWQHLAFHHIPFLWALHKAVSYTHLTLPTTPYV